MLLISVALAQAPSEQGPPPEPAPSAAPEATPEPTPPAPLDPTCAADREILDGLLLLHGPRPEAGVAALITTGDPRVIDVLADVVRVRESGDVVEAAVLGLAAFPGAIPVLGAWVLDSSLPSGTRAAAARALGDAGSTAAADMLVAATADPKVSGSVRTAAIDTLRVRYPERIDDVARVSDAGGVAWVMTGSATGLGYGMATAGHFGRTQLEALGAVAGAAGGATGGWFYARKRPVTAGDAAHVTLSEWAGGIGGLLIAGGTTAETSEIAVDRAWLAGLVGVAGGATIGGFTAPWHPGTGRDAWETAILTGAGVATVGSLYGFAVNGASEDGLTLAGVSTLVGFGAFSAAAPQVRLKGTDLGFVGLGTAWGAVVGGYVPLVNRSRNGLAVGTAGAAGIAAWGTSGLYDRPADEMLGGYVGLVAGTTLGSGLALLDPDAARAGWGAVLGGTAGTAAGIGLAALDPAKIDGSDILWGSLATGWVTWQTIGWVNYAQADVPTGIAFTSIGGTATAAAIGSRWAEVPYGKSLTMGSAALWGTYVGGVTAALSDGNVLQATLIGGDVALVASGIVLVPGLDVSPVVVALADTGGIVLGGTATLIAGLASQNEDVLLGASLGGAGVGMVTGAIVGARLDRRKAPTVGMAAPQVPGSWGLAPLVAAVEGETVYGATVMAVGW